MQNLQENLNRSRSNSESSSLTHQPEKALHHESNQTSEALKEASQTFHNLVGHPEMLESYGENLWEMFEDSLSGREEFDRDTLYDRCMLYDALRRTFRSLAKIKWHPGYVFSISYGPES